MSSIHKNKKVKKMNWSKLKVIPNSESIILGKGSYGLVLKGYLSNKNINTNVAIKLVTKTFAVHKLNMKYEKMYELAYNEVTLMFETINKIGIIYIHYIGYIYIYI